MCLQSYGSTISKSYYGHIQHCESNIYKNGCKVLIVVYNPSRSHTNLAHTIRFMLEQMQGDLCIT